MEIIGAEATVKIDKTVVKIRKKKNYRIKEIDDKLRYERTRKETKMLSNAKRAGVKAPNVLNTGRDFIEMQKISGKTLRDCFDSLKNWKEVCEKIGESIAKLHSNDLIHGDLTTSNMILTKKGVYLIDFGLGFESKRSEDKAVDIHVLEEALTAKHHKNSEKFFKKIIQSYDYADKSRIMERLEKLRKRGRYL